MSGELTTLLQAAGSGDKEALNHAVALVYVDLRRLARRCRGGEQLSLNTTGLVHECYLRFLDSDQLRINDRAHFFNLAARVMRNLLCDYARDRLSKKRGGEARRITLDDFHGPEIVESEQCLAIDRALERLAKIRPRQAKIVECRFFAGLTEAETAEALNCSLRSVQRDWAAARQWLARELN